MTCLGATAFVINLWADARKARVPPPELQVWHEATNRIMMWPGGRSDGSPFPPPNEPVSMDG